MMHATPPPLCGTILLIFAIAGCAETRPNSGLRTIPLQLGAKRFTLEVADSEAAREKGLMKRDSMPADWGMIFVFNHATENPFWMKNTRFPLDILYIDSDQKIIAIRQMKPYDLTPVASPTPYRWAIELNQGAAQSAGVKPGDTLNLPESVLHAAE